MRHSAQHVIYEDVFSCSLCRCQAMSFMFLGSVGFVDENIVDNYVMMLTLLRFVHLGACVDGYEMA